MTSAIICTLWSKCGALKHPLADWMTVVLMPAYKKGDSSALGSYRPIAFLLHVRKEIESAKGMLIWKNTNLEPDNSDSVVVLGLKQ